MKIAFYTDFFYPELSGISGTVKKMAKSLADDGNEILIIAPQYSKKEFARIGKIKDEINMGDHVKISRLPSFSFPFSAYTRIFPCIGKTFFEIMRFKPDIIHTHTPFSFELLLTAKILRIPLIGTNHTPIGDYILGPKIMAKAMRKFYAWFYNRCRFVSVPSQFLADYMEEDGFKQIHAVISNPIVLERFKKDFSKIGLKKEFAISDHSVIYTGRLSLEKNIDVLIRAVLEAKREIPDINLVIAGYGPEEKRLKRLAQDVGITKNIKFLGYVSDEDYYPKIFKACELFVIASTAETEGMSMAAAMASGLPIIAADAKALPEYMQGNGFLFEPGNHIDLSKKIIAILKDPDLQEVFSKKSLESVISIDIGPITERWEEIYSRMVH